MGSPRPLWLLLLLAAAHPGGRGAARAQGPGGGLRAPSGPPAPFWVRLSPESVAVRPGGSVWLNCSSSCRSPEGTVLRTQLRQGQTVHGPGWVSYQLLDVRPWSSAVLCVVTCAGETRTAKATVTAYKPPRSVILEPPALHGDGYTLRCHITHVFPVGLLVVSLRHGGRVIYSESLERHTGLDLANVTVTHTLRSPPRDLWQPVTCHARLILDDGRVVRWSSTPLVLAWNPASRAVASTAIAALGVLLLAMGAFYLYKCQAMRAGT